MDRVLVRAAARRIAWALALAAGLVPPISIVDGDAVAAPSCPPLVSSATRLLVVGSSGFDTARAQAALYARRSVSDPWQSADPPFPVMLGRNGLGWAWDQAGRYGPGPVKREGDGRTPAGVFRAGAPFGHSARPLGNYLTIRTGTVCVDDVRSRQYNRITTLDRLGGGYSHEKMWQIGLYDRGLVVEHATNAPARGGSCIFLHVWRGPGRPTAGCVAMERAQMSRVQAGFDGRAAVIAILPKNAADRLAEDCGF